MEESIEYLVPDYYSDFSCKMGKCRNACCVGWPISVSMADYFRLIGLQCDKKLRARLDCAMHILPDPAPERYAQITPRYDGNCPLRMDDGRCMLQARMGEDVLPAICRLYPRGPRSEGDYECSCANSCEAVIEMLFRLEKPISFVKKRLNIKFDKPVARTVFFETVGREQEIRLYFIRAMQLRSAPFPARFAAFKKALCDMDEALNAGDGARVNELLNGEISVPSENIEYKDVARLELGLRAANGMVELIDERSASVREYGLAALKYFQDDSVEKYIVAKARFEEQFPRWEIYFENMLVNHMFFERFPFQDRPENLPDEFNALCCVYALLRFLCIGWMADKEELDELTDVCAAAFRLIDHTSFDRYAAHMLKRLKCDDDDSISQLISL